MRLILCSKPQASMSAHRLLLVAVPVFLVAFCLSVSSAMAQLPQTRVTAVFPSGGQVGTTLDVSVPGGTDLEELDTMIFSHAGIQAVQKFTEANGEKKPVNNTFVVTIGKDVPPGLYELQVSGYFGLSNPRTFAVGARPEIQETEPNNDSSTATAVELNSLVNARSNSAADIDYYKFTAKKGQRILAAIRAARIDSEMIPVIELYDANGRRFEYVRHSYRDDAILDFTAPVDGDFFLRVYDFVYGGGNNHYYRLDLHTAPYIDFVLPPAGKPGSTSQYTLYGRNLPGGQPAGVNLDGDALQKLRVNITLPSDASVLQPAEKVTPVEAGSDGFSYTFNSPAGSSNPVQIHFAAAPVVLETEPNDLPEQAQKITVPTEVGGQFQSRADIDYYTFEAKAQEVYWVEVFGQRSGSLADPVLKIEQVTVAADGKETVRQLSIQDDVATNLYPRLFDTVSDDPVFKLTIPADGAYRVSVRDRYYEARGNPRLVYRLSIVPENQDFRLVALPIAPQLLAPNVGGLAWPASFRRGDSLPLKVMVFRSHGFNGPVDVTVEGLPAGVACPGTTIGTGLNEATLVLRSTEDAKPWRGDLRIVGKASVDDAQKARVVTNVKTVLKTAQDALPKLQEEAKKQADALAAANVKLKQAEEAAKAKPDDKALAAKVEQEKKKVAPIAAAAKKADDALKAGQAKIAAEEAALKKAEQEYQASIREVTHASRTATVYKDGSATVPTKTRLARSLPIAISERVAPFQLLTDVTRVDANQNRQIVVPIELIKRDGFDNNVALTFVTPPKNITVVNKPIAKGRSKQVLKINLPANAPIGTYALQLQGVGQVSYKRNPEKVVRLQEKQKEVATAAADAATGAKTTAAALAVAVKAVQAADAEQKKTTAAKTAAAKVATDKAAALKTATAAKVAADKAFADADAASKAAAKKAADAQKAADGDKENKGLAAAAAAAKKAADAAAAKAKQAGEAKTAAEKALATATAAAKAATDSLAAADKALTDANAALKTAQETQAKADAAAKAADAKSKAATAAKTAADKAVQAAVKAGAAKNINVTAVSTPIVIEIKKAPATLAASVPGGGKIKKGAKLEVKVTVNRAKEFTGPVTLSLPSVPYVSGLSAQPVTVPADAKEGVLTIQAAADATTTEDKAAADKAVKDAADALKKATDEKTKAEKARTVADTAVTAAETKLAAAKKAAAAKADDANLKKVAADAEKAVAAAKAAAQKAVEALTAATKAVDDATAAADQANTKVNEIELALAAYNELLVVRATMEFEGKAAVDASIKLDVTK